jgi:hypothetical protein
VRGKTARKAVGRKERKDAKVQRRKGRGSRAKIKRVSGDSPCSVEVCAAKPASPNRRKNRNAKTRPYNLLVPKSSILAGLVKSLAVSCGLNEVSP